MGDPSADTDRLAGLITVSGAASGVEARIADLVRTGLAALDRRDERGRPVVHPSVRARLERMAGVATSRVR